MKGRHASSKHRHISAHDTRRLEDKRRYAQCVEEYQTPGDILDKKLKSVEKKRWLRWLMTTSVITAATVYLLFGVIFGIGYVKGTSMQPYLQNGDIFFFSRLGEYSAGDVVVLKRDGADDYVKRIIATPGQTIDFDDENGIVLIDGKEYPEAYIYKRTTASGEYPLTLGGNEYFVMGDNRDNSADSRVFGAVERKEFEGKLLMFIRTR